MTPLDRLADIAQVEPPAPLDALVKSRLMAAVVAQRGLEPRPAESRPAESRPAEPAGSAIALPFAERCVYGVGLVTFGGQALALVARFVWRTLAG